MTSTPWHPSQGPQTSPPQGRTAAGDRAPTSLRDIPLAPGGDNIAWHRADCCTARAAFRVLLPVLEPSDRNRELLFCGHHFRACRAALAKSGVVVSDADNHLVGPSLSDPDH